MIFTQVAIKRVGPFPGRFCCSDVQRSARPGITPGSRCGCSEAGAAESSDDDHQDTDTDDGDREHVGEVETCLCL